jgi:hypothetical protein
MGTLKNQARIAPPTFPHKAQPVALSQFRTDRSPPETRQFRHAILAALTAPGGLILRASPIISLFAASLIMLAPTHAAAQEMQQQQDPNQEPIVSVRDRPRPELDPLGLRFGGFDLNASLELAATATDNVFAEETGASDDIILSLSPRARLSSHWSRHALAFEAGGTFPSHQDFSQEDVNTGYARADGRYDIGPQTSLSGSIGAAHRVEPRTDPDRPPRTVPPVEYDQTDVGIGIAHTFNRVRVSANAAQHQYDYDGTQAFRSFDETVFGGRAEVAVTPRIGLLLQATTDERDYDNSPIFNSDGQTYLVGATVHLTDLMRGQIAVGQFNRDYDSGMSEEGLAVDANLEWYVTRLTTLTFTASRNTEDTVGATTASPFVATRYGARIDHELLRNLILSAGVWAGTRDYDVVDLKDDVLHADVGADYILNRRWALRARYAHDEVDSSGGPLAVGRGFEVNEFTVGLAFRL